MDEKRRSGFRNSRKPYQKGRFVNRRPRQSGPPSDSQAAEDLAEFVIKILAREHETVQIQRSSNEPGHSHLTVSCDPTLTGRIIGKGGKTISALRLLVRSVASRLNRKIDIEITS